MESKQNQEFNFESTDLISYINSKRKPILILTLIAFVVSTIASFLIESRYESRVILFPASSSSISQNLLTESDNKRELLTFGEEADVEQLLQVLNSDEIRDAIIKKYDLYNHYDIDTSSEYKKFDLYKKFNRNISFYKTEYLSIEINVLDANAQMAADIANDIASLVDTTMNKIKKSRAIKAFEIVNSEYTKQKALIKLLDDSLKTIRQKGVMNYESQAEVMNDAYAVALAQGKSVSKLEEKLSILAEYGGAYVSVRDLLFLELRKLSSLESKLNEAKVDCFENIPYSFIVSKAEKAEKRTYPIRWLVISISTLSAFILSIVLLIFIDKFHKYLPQK